MLPPSTHVSTVTPRGFKPTRLVKIYSCFSAVHVPHFVWCISNASVLSKQLPLRLLLHSDGTERAGAYPAGTLEPGAPQKWDNHSVSYSDACSEPWLHPDISPSLDLFANGKPHQLELQIAIWMSYLPVPSLLRLEKCQCKGSVLAVMLFVTNKGLLALQRSHHPVSNGNLTISSVSIPTSTGMHTLSLAPLDKKYQVTRVRKPDIPWCPREFHSPWQGQDAMLFSHQGEAITSVHVTTRATPDSDGFLFWSPFAGGGTGDIRWWEQDRHFCPLALRGLQRTLPALSCPPLPRAAVCGPAPPGDDARAEAGPT